MRREDYLQEARAAAGALGTDGLRALLAVLEARERYLLARLPSLLENDHTRPMHKAKGGIDEVRSLREWAALTLRERLEAQD